MLTPKTSRAYQWIRVPTQPRSTRHNNHVLREHEADLEFALPAPDVPNFPRPPTAEGQHRFSFEYALETIGVPSTNLSPEEELIDLLHNAAEIEHGLMLQYLYASYSCKMQVIAGVLRSIAIEEMGHFVCVQNLLMACGAEPYLGHSDWDDKTLFQPYPFKLEPVSMGSLAKYTIGEMPDQSNVPANVIPDIEELLAQADAAAGVQVETHRVGLLYAKIYWLLRSDDLPLEDPTKEPWRGFPVAEMAEQPELAGRHVGDDFVTDASDANALPEHWKGNYTTVIVAPITGRQAALQAIADISAQGEGFEGSSDDHFERLVEAWRLARTATDLALPTPVNPHYGSPAPAGGGDEITSVNGRLFARLGDGLYELVLLCTAANLLLPAGTAPNIRAKPAKAAIVAMRDCLGAVARALLTIPIADPNPSGRVCGLPFSVVAVDVSPDLKTVLERARVIIEALHEVADEIEHGSSTLTLKSVAQGVIAQLDEGISPRLDSLAV